MAKLRSVRLLVDDYPANFMFYRDVMKFPVVWGDENGPYGEFQASDDVTIGLFQKDLMAEVLKAESSETSPSDSFMLIFKADGTVDNEFNALAPHSKQLIGPTDREGWGVRTSHIRGPDNALLEINKGLEGE